METLLWIGKVLLVLMGLFLIAVVLLQPAQSTGVGAIGGAAETFFGKNKSKTYEGKMVKATKIVTIVFVVLSIVVALLQ